MKKILVASMVVGFILTGCNTVKGVGQDVSKVGDVVTNTAEKTQDKL
ncbi:MULTISPECIES: entericidin A/B family lipoprotein [Acinetobacter]|uniref:Entericidin A/B family lipoprotein n=1 Tax=Acinetobacter rongchengensis TaxID=2419601 RepID=A0A3A8F121_9GAMM|nr:MULTISPECIES: entericidin A/B family lipoprotein [Acinetobacter]RKG40118.1 entericidin A/B family lipoprotein [Acinetobacter rongchengensis]